MNKRGQVTIFIILGLLIIVIIGFIYFQRGKIISDDDQTQTDERFVTSQIEPIRKLVSDCVTTEAIKGIRKIGKQGGYYDPIKFEPVGDYNIAYGCYVNNGNNVNNLPLLSMISKEFDKYINSDSTVQEIDKCINDFKFLKDKGINVADSVRNIKSDFQYNKVGLNIQHPLVISKGDYSTTVDRIFSEIYIGMGKLHKVASDIINEECNGISFDIDSYIKNNEPIATIGMQYYQGKTYVYLSSIVEGKEEPLDFHFVLENVS